MYVRWGLNFDCFFEARRRGTGDGTVMHDDAQVSPSQVDRQNCFSTVFQRGHLAVEGRTRFCVFFFFPPPVTNTILV